MVGAIFIPIFYYHFILSFTGLLDGKKKSLIFGYILALFFLSLSFSPLFIKKVELALMFEFWPKPGILFHPFLLFWLAYAVYCTFLLAKHYRAVDGIKKVQTKFILWGITIGYLGGVTNYFLWYNIKIIPIGNILVSVYVVFTAYAILKYHLMDIKLIAAQLFSTVIVLVTFLQIFYAESQADFFIKGVIFFITLIFAILLIRSVIREVERREQMEKLANELAIANKKRERINKQLQKANVQLKRLDETKSEFISIASHQLRTPLTAIKGYGSMLLDGDFGNIESAKQRDAIQKMFISGNRLISLVENLLNISRIESGRIKFSFEPKQLTDLVREVYENLKKNAEDKKLYLRFIEPKQPLPLVIMDDEKIRQVAINFIDNAIKYTKDGGVTVSFGQKNGMVECCVQDTGMGVEPEEQARLFKKFSRGKDANLVNTEGTGLGLYVANIMIEAHKGKIWIESEGVEGRGSKFCFALPLADSATAKALVEENRRLEQKRQGKKSN
ncbi:hypothetical protein A3I35_03410 [Candidatus Falkowbacteria bacterium RIFCSPLOWO2_02_FULL_45_15]|uniref:histidine kinase n=1 Tax=Candidatus Falkowbacteria bacterium RIFCSPLOWO2_02_FULL_45_15 TaxID=1797988 RepID=A0A1F5RYH6_9BACT|nr:MAG: hypothetical protein A3I35_03410 [Candidatus Falkowbacteria bacterium RIFCSPLOWO2_02_FULL_45_15]